MALLVTGGSGNLGKALVKTFPDCLYPTHSEMDITDQSAVFNFIKKHKPEIIIHAAALTGIPPCENNKDLAWMTNIGGTNHLISACLSHIPDCHFVYVSTACVFYGDRGSYTEQDLPYPKNYYALTKLIGEFVVNRLPKYLVIRTNFVAWQKWPHPKAFVDRFGTYLFAEGVARGVKEAVEANMEGIVHVVGDRKMSIYELAKLTTPAVEPMTLAEYDGPPLTVDMSLDTVRWKKYRIGETV